MLGRCINEKSLQKLQTNYICGNLWKNHILLVAPECKSTIIRINHPQVLVRSVHLCTAFSYLESDALCLISDSGCVEYSATRL